MKNSMLCLLPSKIAPRGRGVDDLLTRGDQMRRAIFIVVTVVGIIGATASPAVASWQITVLPPNGAPGNVVLWTHLGAQGGICGDQYVLNPPANCDANHKDFYQIFIDPFWVSTAPYSVSQTITVDADLYYYNGFLWARATYWRTVSAESLVSIPPFLNLGWTFGNPAHEVVPSCSIASSHRCWPVFYGLPGGYFYTVVVTISWLNSSTRNLLARASYIPGTDPSVDIGCAKWASGSLPQQPVVRCIPDISFALGLPTNQVYVGDLYFFKNP